MQLLDSGQPFSDVGLRVVERGQFNIERIEGFLQLGSSWRVAFSRTSAFDDGIWDNVPDRVIMNVVAKPEAALPVFVACCSESNLLFCRRRREPERSTNQACNLIQGF